MKKLFPFLSIVLSFLVLSSFSFGQQKAYLELFVTKVATYNINRIQYADIDLNNIIKIKEIKIKKIAGGKIILEFPNYTTKEGKIYENVRILSNQLNNRIIEAIELNKPAETNYINIPGDVDFKITKFYPYKNAKSKLKVFVEVVFNDSLTIECKIFDGNKGPWVSWPERKEGKDWIKQVLLKKVLKEKVEAVLLQRYKTLKGESSEGWE